MIYNTFSQLPFCSQVQVRELNLTGNARKQASATIDLDLPTELAADLNINVPFRAPDITKVVNCPWSGNPISPPS